MASRKWSDSIAANWSFSWASDCWIGHQKELKEKLELLFLRPRLPQNGSCDVVFKGAEDHAGRECRIFLCVLFSLYSPPQPTSPKWHNFGHGPPSAWGCCKGNMRWRKNYHPDKYLYFFFGGGMLNHPNISPILILFCSLNIWKGHTEESSCLPVSAISCGWVRDVFRGSERLSCKEPGHCLRARNLGRRQWQQCGRDGGGMTAAGNPPLRNWPQTPNQVKNQLICGGSWFIVYG